MRERIVHTTDGKYVGQIVDTSVYPIVGSDGAVFDVSKMQEVGGGKRRYSNSNYVIETKEVK